MCTQWRSRGASGPCPPKAHKGGHHIICPPPSSNRWAPIGVWDPGPDSIVTRLKKKTRPAINIAPTPVFERPTLTSEGTSVAVKRPR